ncbi:MAG TPA: hypothetical protein VGN74_02390 [Brevundimonas sp.]|uniref:hypothetical protein n=1 Tax=Brevundimonas sp. TaxID=1871086 RepID=UPI002E112AA2|nr:hypothetical protein [Brevundimonas sp.]
MRILVAALLLLSACATGPRPGLDEAQLAALAAGIETDCGLQPRSLLRVQSNRYLMIWPAQPWPPDSRPLDGAAFACISRSLDAAALDERGVQVMLVGSSI